MKHLVCCKKIKDNEDEWDEYMMAALQREQESESDDDKDSDSSGSVDSLPTYPLV